MTTTLSKSTLFFIIQYLCGTCSSSQLSALIEQNECMELFGVYVEGHRNTMFLQQSFSCISVFLAQAFLCPLVLGARRSKRSSENNLIWPDLLGVVQRFFEDNLEPLLAERNSLFIFGKHAIQVLFHALSFSRAARTENPVSLQNPPWL